MTVGQDDEGGHALIESVADAEVVNVNTFFKVRLPLSLHFIVDHGYDIRACFQPNFDQLVNDAPPDS